MSRKRKKQKNKLHSLRKITKIHSIFTLGVFLFYVGSSIFIDPSFIIKDTKEKYAQAAGISLSLHIVGQPSKPTLSATTSCSFGFPRVSLSWNQTEDTDTYDINRDAQPLITGLTTTNYVDFGVQKSSTYTYTVTAQGPRGQTASDDVSVTTLDCPNITPAQTFIDTIDGKQTTSTNTTKNQKPTFTGSSNIPNGQISITVEGQPTIFSTTTTNNNGYWQWTPPVSLALGLHTIFITITDPQEPLNTASNSYTFQIVKSSKDKENDDDADKDQPAAQPVPQPTPAPRPHPSQPQTPTPEVPQNPTTPIEQPELPQQPTIEPPFDLHIYVENPQNIAYIGKDLEINAEIKNITCLAKDLDVQYDVLDQSNDIVLSGETSIECGKNAAGITNTATADDITQKIKVTLPSLMKPGKYRLVLKVPQGNSIVSAEVSFEVKEIPLITIGGFFNEDGIQLTKSDILKYTSWILIILLIILFLFLTMLIFEHHLAQHAAFQITEDFLMKRGFIPTRRKEVSK